MRWSRHQTDTSLTELMGPAPAEDQQDTRATEATEDTHVRLWRGDGTGTDAPAPIVGDEQDGAPADDFLDDEDYLPQQRSGPGRLTVALVAALVLAVGVLGGVWVEKQLGGGGSAAAGMPGGTARGQGLPGGSGMPGGGGMPGGDASGSAGGAASSAPGEQAGAAGRTGSGTATTPVVVGTVSSAAAKSLVVTDLGGTKHTVGVTSTTTVTTPYGHGPLEKGDTVSVSGSTASDGSVTATGLTVS